MIRVLLLVLVSLSFAAREKVESVVALVDGKVILQSELMSAVEQSQGAPGFGGLSPQEQKAKVLESLIDEKVIMSRASRDSIEVSDDEVRNRVDMHLQSIALSQGVDQYRLEQAIQAQLGMTMAQYREQLSAQYYDQYLMARIRQRYIGLVQPTRKDVEAFYQEYRDSLPKQYNSIKVSHIQLPLEASTEIVDSVRNLAVQIIDSLDQGIAWESLVARHSQDTSARQGGDLGFWRKGSLEPSFERVAWRMQIGQYSEIPVKTRLGWHIIKILAKKDEQLRTAQILLRVKPSVADSIALHQRLDSLVNAARSGADFVAMAKTHSQDPETNWRGGSLGWMERNQLDSAYQQEIANLEDGEVSDPVQIENHWHIFKLDESMAVRSLTLEDDYNLIEDIVINKISSEKMQVLVEKWRKEVFIEVRNKK